MNVLERIKNAITADVHELLDQKEEKNPLSLLNQYLRQCEQEVNKAHKLVERQQLLKNQFVREVQEAEAKAAKRSRQAELAQQANEQELYQFAILEKEQHETRAAKLKESAAQAEKDLTELEQKYEQMKHKLKDMQIKRMELMGRENVARAHRKMDQVIDPSSLIKKTVFKFDELENYMDRLEQKVNADYYASSMEVKLAKLEKDWKKEETTPSV
ncbi:PspA/IM30 family protein [Fictibacillus phosphorivorans]|uniref:PspA/IM30 family protein n=1 Tax=Fictibacillus phosphorivorans TaxID=1221500 RepID=UPI0020412C2B|nr:PspA/IM30 family protein [Fictibacillus phosphorivorans]MCM3719570.1 PspA/IM30 family protein [Fictibacillus phosphorivorans]MCM3777261.1 PspA/IM30 family protein [Fictibacillus phosphorivorans]